MSEIRSAFIFPAFTVDYSNHPGERLPGFNEQFSSLLQAAAKAIDPVLSDFSFVGETFPEDELRTQYLTYIYSCSAAAILRKNSLVPVASAGYSMGIYAAMSDAGAISFESGLQLIRLAYHAMKISLKNGQFGMGTLIGLSRNDIVQLISHSGLQVEIANQNAPYSFVVAGVQEDLSKLLELAKTEGVLHTRDLGVSIPYHARFLASGALNFGREIVSCRFGMPQNPIVSLIDQTILSSEESMRTEVVRNLFNPLNWLMTQQWMLGQQITLFVECGASKGLIKNAKFVDGEYRFLALDSALRGNS